MCSVDWAMVLEFVKALAGPTATVIAVFLVSFLGVRTFRMQKALDRRLDWYERAYSLLDETEDFYSKLPKQVDSGSLDQDWLEDSRKAGKALRDHLGRSWLYGDDDAHDAVGVLFDTIHKAHERMLQTGHFLPDETRQIVIVCAITSLRLSMGIRKHLALPPLKPRA